MHGSDAKQHASGHIAATIKALSGEVGRQCANAPNEGCSTMDAINQEVRAANARIAQLEAQLKAVQAKQRSISFKVTQERLDDKTGKMVGTNGAISAYGLGRFPVTLYRGQWERLIEATPALQAFIEANASLLSVKA
jgi:hypothetical protein